MRKPITTLLLLLATAAQADIWPEGGDLSALTNGAVVTLDKAVRVTRLTLRGETNGVWTIRPSNASARILLAGEAVVEIGAGRLDCRVPVEVEGDTLHKRGAGKLRLFADDADIPFAISAEEGTVELRQGVTRPNLAAFWRFDDEEDIGADATPEPVAPLSIATNATHRPTLVDDGVSGKAIRFGESSKTKGSTLICRNIDRSAVPTGSSAFTFSFWMRPTTLSGLGPNFIHVARTNTNVSLNWGNGFYFGSVIDGNAIPFKSLAFYTCGWSRSGKESHTNEVAVATFDSPLTDGAWHHVVGTYSNRIIRLYVDGTLRDEVRRTNDLYVTSSPAIMFSRWGTNGDGNHKYNGDLDEVQWLRGAWSPEEVRAEYLARVPRVSLPSLHLADVRTREGAAVRLTGGTQTVSRIEGAGTVTALPATTLVLPEGVVFAPTCSAIRDSPLVKAEGCVLLPRAGCVEWSALKEGEALDAFVTLARAGSLSSASGTGGWTLSPAPSSAVAFTTSPTAFTLRIGEPDNCWISGGCRLNVGSIGCAFEPFVQTTDYNASAYGFGYNAPNDDGSCDFSMTLGTNVFSGVALATRLADDKIYVRWTITPAQDSVLGNLAVRFELPCEEFAGGSVTLDGSASTLPLVLGKDQIVAKKTDATTFEAFDASGAKRLAFILDAPLYVNVHDARVWNSQTFSVRIQPAGTRTFAAGEAIVIGLTLVMPRNTQFQKAETCVMKADADWIPMPPFAWPRAGTALDFSKRLDRHAPAGKFGRVVRKGAHFEFEGLPGVPQRFYGVNAVQSTVAPKCGEAEFAAGLARLGYNTIRLHHHEAYIVKGGSDDPGAVTLDAGKMDRFERLVAACVTNGLYLTTDLYTSRSPITWRAVGIERDGKLETADLKNLVLVHEPAFSNLVAFTRTFLRHPNPYLGGRCLAEEPAMIGISLINEGAVSSSPTALATTYPPWRTAWTSWIAAKKASDPATYGGVSSDVPTAWTPFFRRFVQEKETLFAERMTRFLRNDLHCLAPLTSLNGCSYPAAYMQVRAACYDYSDDHFYYDHPSFLATKWQLPSSIGNANPLLGDNAGTFSCVWRRLFGAPYCVTEFNYCAPNQFRASSGLLAGALAAGQDWDGVWRFAWQHGGTDVAHPNATIGSFDLAGDPINRASERAAICLFLRRDLSPLERSGATCIRPADVARPCENAGHALSLAGRQLAWSARLGHVVSNDVPAGVTSVGTLAEARELTTTQLAKILDATEGAAPLSEATVDTTNGTMRIVTPRTAGIFAPSGLLEAGPLVCDVGEKPAALWASSLDGLPLAESGHILLTHLTDAVNTGMTFDDFTRKIELKAGTLPHLMRRATAHVRMSLGKGRYRVEALYPDGTPRRRLNVTREDGSLAFDCDVGAEATATWLYEITRLDGFTVFLQ